MRPFIQQVKPGTEDSRYRIEMKDGVIPDDWAPEGSAQVRAVMSQVGFTRRWFRHKDLPGYRLVSYAAVSCSTGAW